MNSVEIFQPTAIESNIAIPPIHNGRPVKYKFAAMAVGDSFLVSCPAAERTRLLSSLNSCRRNIEKRYGMKFITRSSIQGIRVWRIS